MTAVSSYMLCLVLSHVYKVIIRDVAFSGASRLSWLLIFLFSKWNKVGSVKEQLAKLFEESLRATFPDESDVQPMMAICNNSKFGDYQWYGLHLISF